MWTCMRSILRFPIAMEGYDLLISFLKSSSVVSIYIHELFIYWLGRMVRRVNIYQH